MSELHQTLDAFFLQLLQHLQQMQGLLETEAEQLSHRESDALTRSVKAKEALAERINSITQTHYQVLGKHGLEANKQGLEQLLSALSPDHPKTRDLSKRWAEINRVTAHCNQLNQSNGAYIGLLRQHVNRSLDIIHGHSQQEAVYGPDGISRRTGSSRRLLSV